MFDHAIKDALDSDLASPTSTGVGALPSAFAVTDLAVASIGAAACEVAGLVDIREPVNVDRALGSAWFTTTIEPVDFELPPVWDPVAGDYQATDGWIRLHTNAPHHKRAALGVLGLDDDSHDRQGVARTVAGWSADSLEAAVIGAGGCAGAMRSLNEWASHPQGEAVATEPLIAWSGESLPWTPGEASRPLRGLRVLDLTRILAGPVATRFLAGWGAEVLRIDPPEWEEPLLAPDVTLGKRCARLDLRGKKALFKQLLEQADVIVHGYRPGALSDLGLGPFDDTIDVALDAYGWSGPWSGRRGFDSLVQMSSGIAHHGMEIYGRERPTPLPVQALDHATGYLMAAAVVRALRGGPSRARLSLARTAALLVRHPGDPGASIAGPPAGKIEQTAWGHLRRLGSPVTIGATPMRWDLPACPLGSHPPTWDA